MITSDTSTLTAVGTRILLQAVCLLLLAPLAIAEPKVFTASVNEDVVLERVYEEREINFTIIGTEPEDSFFIDGTIEGIAGLDAVSGRMVVEILSLSKSGMAMKAVGFIESEDKQKGIDACTQWQTRMFEESKLCYAAQVKKGSTHTIVVDTEEEAKMPVAAGQ